MNSGNANLAADHVIYIDKKERVKNYWSLRSSDFSAQRLRELASPLAERWIEEICSRIPSGRRLHILDVGTGTGFFAFLMDQLGHDVTGIDLTPDMIREARASAALLKSRAEFLVMDAETLSYPDECFDVILTRNLTWTLPHPQKAYAEWYRVLKKGGILINFDANYGKEDYTGSREELPENHAHKQIEYCLLQECERIKNQMEISYHARPAWDVELLEKAGFAAIELDLTISSRIYQEIDEFYNPTPLFLIRAEKR